MDYMFTPTPLSYSVLGISFENYSVPLAKKAALPSSIARRALARDKGCVFTGVSSPTRDSETLEVTWIFPPFLGYMLSDDPWLERTYHDNPDACDLSQFMVATNAISGCRDVVALFYENKLGVDVDDNYRIFVFDKSERMLDAAPFKSHVTFTDGQDRPTDQFLRLHFQRCLAVSVCGGDPTEDYEEQEIGLFMMTQWISHIKIGRPRLVVKSMLLLFGNRRRIQEKPKINLVQSGVVVRDTRTAISKSSSY